ncbi:hypothetical protein EOM09_02620 [bacterium]|nr:hypothetical protein [bacterium]
MSFFSVLLKKKTDRHLIEVAKRVFIKHHPEWEEYQISNRKIIYESLRYYIITEPEFKNEVLDKYEK